MTNGPLCWMVGWGASPQFLDPKKRNPIQLGNLRETPVSQATNKTPIHWDL
jgi:hypothetical protein